MLFRSLLLGFECGAYSTGNNNIFIGNNQGKFAVGDNNVYLGNTSYNNTGNNNIAFIIGSGPSPSYDSKFIVQSYYNLSGEPLIFGDFDNNIVYINTTSNIAAPIGATQTALVVNGTARAGAFTSFTGLHKVLIPNVESLNLQMGMLLRTTRCLSKADPLNPVIECDLAVHPKDKTVYAIYANYESAPSGETVYYGAAVGEGCILATNINGDISNGDYLTSSYAGFSQRQDDDLEIGRAHV